MVTIKEVQVDLAFQIIHHLLNVFIMIKEKINLGKLNWCQITTLVIEFLSCFQMQRM